MATLVHTILLRPLTRPRVVVWLAAMGILTALLALLSIAIKNDPTPSQDITVLNWVIAWELPGLTGLMETVSFLTNNRPAMVLGLAGVLFLWLLGLTREAKAFAVIGVIIGVVASLGDSTLGEVVARMRPFETTRGHSFPSGHTFGTTVFFGFWGFLGI